MKRLLSWRRPSWPPLRFALLTLPPRRARRSLPRADGTIPGVLHIHTTRSDGRGTPDEIAAAAARAGVEVHRVHRSRRRHATARPADVSIRRAVSRRRRDQHRRRPLHRARHAGVAVSAGGRSARRRRGRPAARRIRHRRASGFAQAGAALERLGRAHRRRGVGQSRHELARPRGVRLAVAVQPARTGCFTIRSGRAKRWRAC